MKILLVTEKFNPPENDRDGGSRLATTIANALGKSLSIMQFGEKPSEDATWNYIYPYRSNNRFENRLNNSAFIREKINSVINDFSIIIFIHISMQFEIEEYLKNERIKIITFPMFLSPSYKLSGEEVPNTYFQRELKSLHRSNLVITPSYLEKIQLLEQYSVSQDIIRVIPRGIDNTTIQHILRKNTNNLNICSIGSIKPQKNTIELIDTFEIIHDSFPRASLKIIGPIQNKEYFNEVTKKITSSKIDGSVSFLGHVPPKDFTHFTENEHIHLSTSNCETFGRAIFETLAMGLPNIVKLNNNAAYDFLSNRPYIFFIEDNRNLLEAIQTIKDNLPTLSSEAAEIGNLYCDKFLSRLIISEITNQPCIGITDYDGTLYHKNDEALTDQCIQAFKRFRTRIICTARKTSDVLEKLSEHKLEVDWVISYSGAVVTTGSGQILWKIPLKNEAIEQLMLLDHTTIPIYYNNDVVQASPSINVPYKGLGLRMEYYNNKAYLMDRNASKLNAIIRLLKIVNSTNRVRVFGDGVYDREMLSFFDGSGSLKGVHI